MNEYRYIEKLIYRENTIKKELNFKSGINVIIGPKGGGKSILLKILWMFKNRKKNSKFIKGLKKFSISLESIKMSDTKELFNISNNEFKWDDKKSDIDNFLKQSDVVKTDLHNIDNIKKERKNFLNDLISKNINNLLDEFNLVIDNYRKLPKNFNELNKINWLEMFKSFKDFSLDNLILLVKKNLLIKPIEIENMFLNKFNKIIDLIGESKKNIQNLKKYSKNYDYLTKLNNVENYIKNLDEMENDFYKYNEKFKKYNKIIKIYNESINLIENKFAESKKINSRLTTNIENLKFLFNKISKQLFFLKEIFNNLKKENKVLILKDKKKSNEIEKFYLSINKEMEFGQFTLINDILTYYLAAPKVKHKENWLSWVEKSIEKIKDKQNLEKDELIKKIISEFNENNEDNKELIDFVELENNENKKYSEMSLGERSILGVLNKLKNMSTHSILFLDQLEDNLDNHSIQNILVEKLNKISLDKQIFIVTHNANIGINTNVDNVIVCELDKENNNIKNKNQYFNISIKKEIEKENFKESKLIYYLEGGERALKLRYQKVFKKR